MFTKRVLCVLVEGFLSAALRALERSYHFSSSVCTFPFELVINTRRLYVSNLIAWLVVFFNNIRRKKIPTDTIRFRLARFDFFLSAKSS